MIIVADQNLRHAATAFADLGEVRLLPGREIRAEHLRDCRCLITRAVTRVDAALLQGSAVVAAFSSSTAGARTPIGGLMSPDVMRADTESRRST